MAYIDISRVRAPSSRGFVGLFARTWAALVSARRRRAAIAELHALDDRSLKDIGLHRGEIEWAVDRRTGRDLE